MDYTYPYMLCILHESSFLYDIDIPILRFRCSGDDELEVLLDSFKLVYVKYRCGEI